MGWIDQIPAVKAFFDQFIPWAVAMFFIGVFVGWIELTIAGDADRS